AVPGWLKSEVGEDYFLAPTEFFGLDETTATDADLLWLANLPDVRHIDVATEQIDGSFLAHMAASSSLTTLWLDGTKVTDRSLADVSHFPRLTSLSLSYTGFSDDGCAHVASLRRLEELGLNGTRITDAGLTHLAGLQYLR